MMLAALISVAFQILQASVQPTVAGTFLSQKNVDPEVEALLRTFTRSDDETYYYYDRVDLNKDGKSELLIFPINRASCGTGGCNLYVFQTDGAGYRQLSRIALTELPMIISHDTTNGWRDLLIWQRGPLFATGEREPYYARLQFDGTTYPLSVSLGSEFKPPMRGDLYFSDYSGWKGAIRLRQ